MTNAMSVKLAPVGESPMPTTRITNAGQPIPVISWESEDGWQTVEIVLGNHPDPGRYLRDLAHQLTAFAHEADAARDQRQPRGYCCPMCTPVPYAINADALGVAL